MTQPKEKFLTRGRNGKNRGPIRVVSSLSLAESQVGEAWMGNAEVRGSDRAVFYKLFRDDRESWGAGGMREAQGE